MGRASVDSTSSSSRHANDATKPQPYAAQHDAPARRRNPNSVHITTESSHALGHSSRAASVPSQRSSATSRLVSRATRRNPQPDAYTSDDSMDSWGNATSVLPSHMASRFRHSEAADKISVPLPRTGEHDKDAPRLVVTPRVSSETLPVQPPASSPARNPLTSPRLWAWATLWVIALACIAIAVNADQHPMLVTAPQSEGRPQPVLPAPVPRDEALEFDARSVQSLVPPHQQGKRIKLVVVNLIVDNVGTSPAMFRDSAQIAIDSKGKGYRADSALVSKISRGKALPETIAAQGTASGIIVFSVPVDAQIEKLRLHNYRGSTGVTIPAPKR